MYVMIQKREKTVEKGRPVEKWNDYLKCWCEVKSLYGKELYTALEAKLENVMNFETRPGSIEYERIPGSMGRTHI